jgi:hypothetical protein
VNRTGAPGSPAKRCAVNPAAFKSPAFRIRMVDRVARCPAGNRRSGLHGPRTFDPSTVRTWRGKPIGDGTCFENS